MSLYARSMSPTCASRTYGLHPSCLNIPCGPILNVHLGLSLHCQDQPSSGWVYQLIEPSGGLSEDPDSEWEVIPEFESSQEMLVDVCKDIEEVEIVAVDADWYVSVSITSIYL